MIKRCYLTLLPSPLLQLSKGCSLHLAQRWSQLFNIQLRRMSILSKDSAPGVIMATGNTIHSRRIRLMWWSKISSDLQFRIKDSTTSAPNTTTLKLCNDKKKSYKIFGRSNNESIIYKSRQMKVVSSVGGWSQSQIWCQASLCYFSLTFSKFILHRKQAYKSGSLLFNQSFCLYEIHFLYGPKKQEMQCHPVKTLLDASNLVRRCLDVRCTSYVKPVSSYYRQMNSSAFLLGFWNRGSGCGLKPICLFRAGGKHWFVDTLQCLGDCFPCTQPVPWIKFLLDNGHEEREERTGTRQCNSLRYHSQTDGLIIAAAPSGHSTGQTPSWIQAGLCILKLQTCLHTHQPE